MRTFRIDPSTHVPEHPAPGREKQELLQSLSQKQAIGKELPQLRLRERRVCLDYSDEKSTAREGCTMKNGVGFEKR